ncbi:hypothetical protein BJY16_006427 [Actinoplanes octamycinicus]|uniref:Pyridoxamine 5'-phosphate oxidase N-terminal domain-containing protein n=1 Tax=Actinoplanes octamycinicus TaxID=135948 RepID=A0A7W7MAD8_9ACTN|nr:pyridoxamine 5'-phosphate oxidase family protein [Actinoplanes octamycinicus]MBB4742968.1 hypothetical protein [Actinoplanes octamycinicus]GIE58179.1 hypothetical protein Aoc01nite_35810 [Actinoplanes octamycinicus]
MDQAVRADRWATVPRLLGEHRYLVLGTADADGNPWATPVFFAADGVQRIVWVSAPGSRHSRNIAVRPTVSITLFDTRVPVGQAEAVYLEATAEVISQGDYGTAIALINAKLPDDRQLAPEDLGPGGPLEVYQATVSRHFVLVRGGDTRFDNVTDARLEVSPPAAS